MRKTNILSDVDMAYLVVQILWLTEGFHSGSESEINLMGEGEESEDEDRTETDDQEMETD